MEETGSMQMNLNADQQRATRGKTPEDVMLSWYHLHQNLTAMVHYFREQPGERLAAALDATTNWAVISTGASVTIAFSLKGTMQ
jgi:uncharacterized membrane protein